MEVKEMKVLIFEVNQEFYAIDILDVERILTQDNITEMPDTLPIVAGVMNYESSIMPVIDLSKKFNLKKAKEVKKAKIIVMKNLENKFGIIVDNVSEVREISASQFEPVPEITIDENNAYIKGLVKIDGKIVICLNISKIPTEKEVENIF